MAAKSASCLGSPGRAGERGDRCCDIIFLRGEATVEKKYVHLSGVGWDFGGDGGLYFERSGGGGGNGF